MEHFFPNKLLVQFSRLIKEPESGKYLCPGELKAFCIENSAQIQEMDPETVLVLFKPLAHELSLDNWDLSDAMQHYEELLTLNNNERSLDLFNTFFAKALATYKNELVNLNFDEWLEEVLPQHWDTRLVRPGSKSRGLLAAKILSGELVIQWSMKTRERDQDKIWNLFLDSRQGYCGSDFMDIYLETRLAPSQRWTLNELIKLKSSRGFKWLSTNSYSSCLQLLKYFAENLSGYDLQHLVDLFGKELILALLSDSMVSEIDSETGHDFHYQSQFIVQSLVRNHPLDRESWEAVFRFQECYDSELDLPGFLSSQYQGKEKWLQLVEPMRTANVEATGASKKVLLDLSRAWKLPPYIDLEVKKLPRIPEFEEITLDLCKTFWQWKGCLLKQHIRGLTDLNPGKLFEVYIGNLIRLYDVNPVLWSVRQKEGSRTHQEFDLVFKNQQGQVCLLELRGGKSKNLEKSLPDITNRMLRQARRNNTAELKLVLMCPNITIPKKYARRLEQNGVHYFDLTRLSDFVLQLADVCGFKVTPQVIRIHNLLKDAACRYGDQYLFGSPSLFRDTS
jgi:hypothetical protein